MVTVILKPYNSNFQTRTLEFKDKSRIKIGRQTSNKTAPTALNGYFDSKVLSRQHAEMFYDKHKVKRKKGLHAFIYADLAHTQKKGLYKGCQVK